MEKRGKIEIAYGILTTLKSLGCIRITKLISKSNLSYDMAQTYCNLLESCGYITYEKVFRYPNRKDKVTLNLLKLTERGLDYIDDFKDFKDKHLEIFEKEVYK